MSVPLAMISQEEDLHRRNGEMDFGKIYLAPSAGDNTHLVSTPPRWHGEVEGPWAAAPAAEEVPLPCSLTGASTLSAFKSPTTSASQYLNKKANFHCSNDGTTGTGDSSNGSGGSSGTSKSRSAGTGNSSSSRTSSTSSTEESGLSSMGMSSISQPCRTSRPALTSEPVSLTAVMRVMSGQWQGDQGEIYTLLFPDTKHWSCVCCDSQGVAMVDLVFEEDPGLVWWGKNRAYFVIGAEMLVTSHWVRWYAAEDTLARKPRFAWTRYEATTKKKCVTDQVSRFQACPMRTAGEAPHTGPSDAAVAKAAAQANSEITTQLVDQGGRGRIWLPNWNQEYRDLLGNLSDFLAAQPDKFTIFPCKKSRRFVVAVADPLAQAELNATQKCLMKLAVRAVMKQVTAAGSSGPVAVSMPDWKETYAAHLGTLRSFLESRPEFVVVPKRGSKFAIALAEPLQGQALAAPRAWLEPA